MCANNQEANVRASVLLCEYPVCLCLYRAVCVCVC